jgi:lipopolysaccharide/colanic/teichoic acid biosynthesis glycosyltransferase
MVISAGALLVLAIPFWMIAALVKLTSKGNVFYRQERMGLDGKPFMIYKFRSMYEDAEAETGPVFASEEDPRRTPIGKLLRHSNIDELPQLWNVLKGDMSLVGPRPPTPREVSLYSPADRRRLAVKPGITCIWQVSGRSNIDFSGQVKLDVQYIETAGFWVDIKILLRTVRAVVAGTGAS